MRVEVNGVRLFFDVEGAKLVPDGPRMREKPTLILIHGAPGGSDHSGFKPMFSPLADVAQIIYLDLHGCGRSDPGPRELWTLEQWADDIRAFCEALEIDKPVVLGQSGGGFVAIQYGARHADHAGKLILASTQARVVVQRIVDVVRRRSTAEAAAAAEHTFLHPEDREAFQGWMQHGRPLYNYRPQDPDGASRTQLQMKTWWSFSNLWYGQQPNLLPLMANIACPTLILTGDDDPICPTEDSDDMLAALPPGLGRLERFERCGHGVWRDHPERAMQVIRDFILS
jgi:pimeloyl-ACP methyl ester carboxylesterase